MSEIKPALPASEEMNEDDEPKLTKKQWEALLNEKSQTTEKPKEIVESVSTPVIETAMTEVGESAIYSGKKSFSLEYSNFLLRYY